MKERNTASALAILSGGMWGSIGLFVNVLGRFGIRSAELTVWRLVFAVILLGSYMALKNRNLLQVKSRDLPSFAFAGLVCLLLFNICYGVAIEKSSMSVAAVLLYTAPFFVMMMSAVLFHEKITVRKVIAVCFAILGCALVSGIGNGMANYAADAYLWGVGAALGYASYSIVSRSLVRKYHPQTVLLYAFLFAAIGGLVSTDMSKSMVCIRQSPVVLLWLLAATMICNLLSYLSYNQALRLAEASHVAVLASVEPAAALLLGALFLREPVNLFHILGVGCIMVSIVILNMQERTF